MAEAASKFTTLATGTSLSASLLALAATGALILGGPRYTDRNQASESCDHYGSGAYLCYDDVVLTATGGKANYTSGQIQCGSATCAIIRIQTDTEASPTGAAIDLDVVSSLTGSGQTIANSVPTASGRTVVKATTGAYVIPPNNYLKVVFTSNPGNVIGQLRLWYVKYYVP